MKIISNLGRFLFFIFLLSNTVAAQINQPSWQLQQKVNSKLVWYELKGLDLRAYDWSDEKFNHLIGEYEGFAKKTKTHHIAGGVIGGFGFLTLVSGLGIEKKECDNAFFSNFCDAHNDLRAITITTGAISLTVGGIFLLGASQKKYLRDAYFVKMVKRYNELHPVDQ